ncbi:RNA polymerase sigma factor [Alkalihalobacterium elongatum]|uniref:RNA polymerase sigma factor n=1 Tax=Alkalihalobacterium elongatum TaxID=2675466 RepID=UPI001C1F2918|nr:sigma-70 family RNA polymerase sigma factor [Alkalihalobacterium elongatum]
MDQIKIVKKAKKGDVDSFEQLILIHKLTMYRVAKTILSRDEDCADAMQEAILKAFQSIHTLREPAFFKSWLIRILMNECHQLHRQRRNLTSYDRLVEPFSDDKGYEKIEIQEILDTLPSEQRQLLKLFHIEDLSIQEISQIYETPENTIKTKLRRAREKIRQHLLKHEEGLTWKNGNNN